jgi:hypothetical protein
MTLYALAASAAALPLPTYLSLRAKNTQTGGPDDDDGDDEEQLRKLMPILAAVIVVAALFG